MILGHSLFSIVLTLLVYKVMQKLQCKLKAPLLNPLLFSALAIIIFLTAFKIDYKVYNQGASLFTELIAPATVALAIPLYKHQELLKKNFKMILTTVFLTSFGHAIIVAVLLLISGFDLRMSASLLPKSVTTAIASDISNSLDGYVNITIATVILTGILGASFAPFLNKVFKVQSKRAQGLALGCSAHAVGTAKAVELGETQATMATLALILSGLIAVFTVPLTYKFLTLVL